MSIFVKIILWIFLVGGVIDILITLALLSAATETNEKSSWGCMMLLGIAFAAVPAIILFNLD
jgi:uncharacterized membrane protein